MPVIPPSKPSSIAVKKFHQRLPGVCLIPSTCAGGLERRPSAVFAAFGTEVDDPVGVADHVEIMLDNHRHVSQVGEAV